MAQHLDAGGTFLVLVGALVVNNHPIIGAILLLMSIPLYHLARCISQHKF
jgi:hypothetical protein